ncbi:MAG: methylation-associated defense system ATP-binding protein MAD8 [Candidatus Acidiferrales bacterium]
MKPQGIRELAADALNSALEEHLYPEIASQLRSRRPGHCMRICDFDDSLATNISRRLRNEIPEAQVFILSDAIARGLPSGLTITSTKLVELRNPLPDGSLRPPLLVFLPPNLRTSAEDSFGVATFEQVSLPSPYESLAQALLEDLPPEIKGPSMDVIKTLRDAKWHWLHDLAACRFLLTLRDNDLDPQIVGAALYEFALVPHFGLLEDPARVPWQIQRNSRCIETLTYSDKTERGRVVELEIQNSPFRAELSTFLEQVGAEDPLAWTRRIALDPTCWRFSFDKWLLPDSNQQPDQVCVDQVTTNLHSVPESANDPRLRELVGQPYLPLGPNGIRSFDVTFSCDPPPNRVNRLAKFLVELVSKDAGPVGNAKVKNCWKTDRATATVKLAGLQKLDLEEGWYFVKVRAVTEQNDPIPLVDTNGVALTSLEPGQYPNESDLFYVLPGGSTDEEATPRSVPAVESWMHAAITLQIKAIRDGRSVESVQSSHCEWVATEPKSTAVKQDEIEVRFGRDGVFRIPVSRKLREVEEGILLNPDRLARYKLRIDGGVAKSVEVAEEADIRSSGAEEFRAIRRILFSAISRVQRSESTPARPLISQAVDWNVLADQILSYANSYNRWISGLLRKIETGFGPDHQKVLAELRTALALDTVSITLINHRGKQREALLAGPTHPLRALWLVCWARLARVWAEQIAPEPNKYGHVTQQSLLKKLAPVNFPVFMPIENGRVFATVDCIHPFWSLYAPTHEEDPRGLLGDVCSAMGLPEPATFGATITSQDLADRVRRYILQHPYVRTLAINVFNAGRASAIAEMLLYLQSTPGLGDLRYDIRLFVADPATPGIGESVEALFSPEATVSTPEADAFLIPTGSHLFPKLSFAVRSIQDFKDKPDLYQAHLTMLFDLFPAEEIGAAPPLQQRTAVAVYGLIQEFDTEYAEEGSFVIWRRQPRHGVSQALIGSETLTDELSGLSETISKATAVVAAGQFGSDLLPVVSLPLRADERALLHQVHENSDWVFTIDRNLGLEFFDHGRNDRPDYLIDYSPDQTSFAGHRFVISSRSISELEAMIKPTLRDYGLSAEGKHAAALLSQLRSLSGRLAMKLISSPTKRAEVLGLALARLYLGYQGAIANQIVLPLDSHLDLYRSVEEMDETVSLQRTDLALFDLNAKARTIQCHLIEVKCYRSVGGLGSYQQLKNKIEQQIRQSEEILMHHFDPNLNASDRPDRLLKNRELSNLLEHYLDRGVRYKIIGQEVQEEARYLLRTLDYGYKLKFTRSALIFDFEKAGTENADTENGIEYYRIGSDLIRELVEGIAPLSQTAEGLAAFVSTSDSQSTIPKLASAAFLAENRDRTVSWEELSRRRTLGEDLTVNEVSIQDIHSDTTAEPSLKGESEGNEEPDSSAAEVNTRLAEEKNSTITLGSVDQCEPVSPRGAPQTDVTLGVNSNSPQYGLLGEYSGRRIALDLNQTHTISLFGVQGGGKSYTLGSVVEMATIPIAGINHLPSPLGSVIFHYSSTKAYTPEFVTMAKANTDPTALHVLLDRYGATPQGLGDIVLLVPSEKVEERSEEFPGVKVLPLAFSSRELQASHWRFLMGAVGSQSLYMKQINHLMRDLRNDLNWQSIQNAVGTSQLPDHLKALAETRLNLARHYIDDSVSLSSVVRPGRLVIVDLRDEFLEKDEALGIFVVVLQLVSDATFEQKRFNKLVVFDEAHKYIENPDLVAGLVEVIREMRHKGTSVMVASQDPLSVPISVIELSTQIILHRFNAPTWLKHIQRANTAFGGLTPEKLNSLTPGEAYVWSSKATDSTFTIGPVKIRCRPRITMHGGGTQTAIE